MADEPACTTTQKKEASPTDASQTTVKFRAGSKKRVRQEKSPSLQQ